MENVVNIIKFKVKYDFPFYRNIIVIAIVTMILNLSKFGNISLGIISQVILTISLLVVFISMAISSASKALKKEQGRVLFMAPIKGKEYLIATYLIFIIYSVGYGVLFEASIIITKMFDINTYIEMNSYVGLVEGLLFNFVILQGTIILARCFATRKIFKFIGIIGGLIVEGIIHNYINRFCRLLPYVYVRISGFEIDIIKKTLIIIFLVFLFIVTSKVIDEKMEIK